MRFSNVGVLAEVVDATRSPWRFVPPALLLAALAALAVGLARPQVPVTAHRKQGTVVLALDRSGSMLAQDVNPDRITASRKAAQSFVKNLPSGFAVGVVTFSRHGRRRQRAEPRQGSGRARDRRHPGRRRHGDRRCARCARSGCSASPARRAPATGKGRAILLLSDGSNTAGRRPLDGHGHRQARRACPIYTIALGTPDGVVDLQALGQGVGTIPVPPDPEALKAIARETGGESFTAYDDATLKKIYDHIGTRVSATKQQKEVTFLVAGAAALLLLAAAGSSWALRSTT